MSWSPKQITSAAITMSATFTTIIVTLTYFWISTDGWSGMQDMSFLAFAIIFGAVLLAIGIVMTIYIVMVVRKNEKIEKG